MNNVNGGFLEDIDFLAKLREKLRGNPLNNEVI